MHGNYQSNNLVYCLECTISHIKYVGQTKHQSLDSFQGHLFDIKTIGITLWLGTVPAMVRPTFPHLP